MKKLSNERIETLKKNISLYTPIFISVLALAVSIFDNCTTRRHNRYSVTPILEVSVKDVNDVYGIVISNHGYGPALVDSCRIFYEMRQIDPIKNAWDTIFRLAFPDPIDFRIDKKRELHDEFTIRIGDDMVLWGASIKDLPGNFNLMESAISRVSMKIYYHSIYMDEFVCSFNMP